jgi:histone H3/H4
MMIQKACAVDSDLPVFVDPRSGLHYLVIRYDECDDIRPLPALDSFSKETQQERMRLAQEALSAEEILMMKQEGYRVRFLDGDEEGGVLIGDDRRVFEAAAAADDDVSDLDMASAVVGSNDNDNNEEEEDDKEENEEEWGEEQLETGHMRRLREIKYAQSTSHLAFEPHAFAGVVHRRVQNLRNDPQFTAEALECVQTYCEHYIVALCKLAYEITIKESRLHLTAADVEFARSIYR